MPYSRVIKTGDGVTTQFAVNFALGYLDPADIRCRVGSEVDGSGNPVYRPITFISSNLIEVGGTPPSTGVRVVFDRTVDKESLNVDFTNGDVLDAENLDNAQKQALMAVHEVLDGRFEEFTSNINMGGYAIQNASDPVNDQDYATKKYVDSINGNLSGIKTEIAQVAGIRDEVVIVANATHDIAEVADISDDVTLLASVASVLSGTASAARMDEKMFTGDGSTTTFTLDRAPGIDENALVWVGGAIQSTADYSVSGTTLTIPAAVADGIAIRTLIVTTVTANEIEVMRNAAATSAANALASEIAAAASAESTADAVKKSETATQAMSGPLTAPYILASYRGLKISEFLTTNDINTDQKTALSTAINALRSTGRYYELDLEGRNIGISGVMDIAAVYGGASSQGESVIRNGRLRALTDTPTTVNFLTNCNTTAGSATVTPNSLTGIEVGMHISGPAVPRETYVLAVNSGAGTITISQKAWRSVSASPHRFRKYNFMLDFSGVSQLLNMHFRDIYFDARAYISIFKGPLDGGSVHFSRCRIDRPLDRGICFWRGGSSNLQIDNCQGVSWETGVVPTDRNSIFVTASENDVKLRNNYIWQFRHTAVLHGSGNVLTGNHWWQGQAGGDDARTAGIVFTTGNNKSLITGNYVDNSWIEFANDASADLTWPLGGGVTVTGNIFTVAVTSNPSFAWLVLAPYTANALVRRISVVSNVFKSVAGTSTIDKPDDVIAGTGSGGGIDVTSFQEISWRDNSYSQVTEHPVTEATIGVTKASGAEGTSFAANFSTIFPWGGRPQNVKAITPFNIRNAAAALTPVSITSNIPSTSIVTATVSSPVNGTVNITADCNTA